MKRKLTAILILVLSLSLVLTGCGGNKTEQPADTNNSPSANQGSEASDGSWERVEKAGKITVGLDDAYPPMGYRDEKTGELIGFDIDMCNLIGEKIGVEFEFVPAEWNSIVPSLLSSHFDVIVSGMNMWPERMEQADFVPYGLASQYIVTLATNPNVDKMTGIDYFKDKQLGTQMGSTGAKVLGELGFEDGKNLSLYKSFPDCTLDLESGRIEAMVIDSFGGLDLIKNDKYVVVGEPLGAESNYAKIGIALRKEDKELQAKIQQAVDELIADGTLGKLAEQWIGEDITAGLK